MAPSRFATLAAAVACLACFIACERSAERDAADGGRASGPSSHAAATGARAATQPRPLDVLVDEWVAGQQEDVAERLLAAVDCESPVEARRLYSMSEPEFAAIPDAARRPLHDSITARTTGLLQIGRACLQEAARLTAAEDRAAARRLLETLRCLGEANRGPEVVLLVDLVGKFLYEKASNALASPGESAATQPGSDAP